MTRNPLATGGRTTKPEQLAEQSARAVFLAEKFGAL